MKISTKGRYALRVMVDLAANDQSGYIPLKDIAQRQGLTIKYLEQIIALLNKAGFLISLRGAGGGYRLAQKPEEITAGDILRAAEGSLAPLACVERGAQPCLRRGKCTTVSFWDGLYRVITEYVDRYTLADLVRDSADGQTNH